MFQHQITCINTNLSFSLNNSSTEEENYTKFLIDFQYKIKQVAIGRGYILILNDKGQVFFKGKLSDLEYLDNYFTKLEIISSKFIKFIASGENFILLIDQFNKIFIYGIFGSENYKKLTEIGMIENNDEIKFISCGVDIAVIVTQKKNELIIGGNLYAFNGKEDNGFGDTNTLDYFIKIDNLPIKSEIKDLQCGYYHTIVLDYNGNIYGSGKNTKGQLGLGKSNKGKVLSTLTQLNVPFKVKKIATTPEGTLLLNNHNELYGSGENYAFQLGFSSKQNVLQFKKIVIDNVCVDNNITKPLIIKKLFNTFKHLTVILTENDGFYLTGQHVKGGFRKLKDINDCKDWKYNYAFLNVENNNDVVYLFQTSYKINENEQKRKDLFEKLKASTKNNNLLSDIVFNFY
ncbi:hypothetical protein ABK040_009010 [Willaertia magna]